MLRLVRNLIRPYLGSLSIILAAMLIETLMGLAAPWPLKVVLDNVVGNHKLPLWLSHLLTTVLKGDGKMSIAVGAALAVVAIATLGAAGVLRRELLHRKRGSVGCQRPANADLSPSAAVCR